mgnify:CR=1 FL=1
MLTLTTAEKLAVISAIENEIGKQKIETGSYAIDRTIALRIFGTVSKESPEWYTPTESIPLLATLALFLEKSGFTRDLSKTLLVDAMKEAMAFDEKAEGPIKDRMKDVKSAMETVRQITGALPKKQREGKTRVCCMAEELNFSLLSNASSSSSSPAIEVAASGAA